MAKLKDIIKDVEKTHGEGFGTMGGWFEASNRIPTGIFPLDMCIGGGIPMGRVTEIFGPEGSGKTNMALKAISNFNRMFPDLYCIFFDMEGTFDPKWAATLGVNLDRTYVTRPDYAEQMSDMMCAYMVADDVGMIVLDSLASVISNKELEESAEKVMMGNSAVAIKRLVNKMTVLLKRRRDDSKPVPTVIWINQIRTNIGVMFGDPETTPGGKSPRFMYSLRLRCYGKAKMEKAISEVLPVARETTVVVKKHKVGITALQAKYDFITLPHKGFQIGDCDDWGLIEAMCRNAGTLTKEKKGYVWRGKEYKTLTAAREDYNNDISLRVAVQAELIQIALAESGYGDLTDEIDGKELVEGVDYDPNTGELIGEAAL